MQQQQQQSTGVVSSSGGGGVVGATRYFLYDDLSDAAQFLECAVCLTPWCDPVELKPCSHIFCAGCVRTLSVCPECRAPIDGMREPNRVLRNMALELPGRCSNGCAWRGSREEFDNSHKHKGCASGGAGIAGSGGADANAARAEATAAAVRATMAAAKSPPLRPAPAPQQGLVNLAVGVGDGGGGGGGDNNDSLDHFLANDEPWSEYGMAAAEYEEAMFAFHTFTSTTTPADGGGEDSVGAPTPTLDFPAAQAAARWLNARSNRGDIASLFASFGQPAAGGSVTFHNLCLWLPANRYTPEVYGTTKETYAAVLQQAHLLDCEQKGYLSLPQAVQLSPVFLGRSLDAAEWRDITAAVDKKQTAAAARSSGGSCDYPRDGVVLHDLLLLLASEREGWDVCEAPPPPTEQQHGGSSTTAGRASGRTASAASSAVASRQQPISGNGGQQRGAAVAAPEQRQRGYTYGVQRVSETRRAAPAPGPPPQQGQVQRQQQGYPQPPPQQQQYFAPPQQQQNYVTPPYQHQQPQYGGRAPQPQPQGYYPPVPGYPAAAAGGGVGGPPPQQGYQQQRPQYYPPPQQQQQQQQQQQPLQQSSTHRRQRASTCNHQ